MLFYLLVVMRVELVQVWCQIQVLIAALSWTKPVSGKSSKTCHGSPSRTEIFIEQYVYDLLTAAAYNYLGALQHTYIIFIPRYTLLLQKLIVTELGKKFFVKFNFPIVGNNAVFQHVVLYRYVYRYDVFRRYMLFPFSMYQVSSTERSLYRVSRVTCR